MLFVLGFGCTQSAPETSTADAAFDRGDAYTQTVADKLDVLLVVDDSNSMAPYQELLGGAYDDLVGVLNLIGSDYRIGVTTTDTLRPDAGQVNDDWVTPDTADAEDVFLSIVSLGTSGSGTEMGLEAARLALEERDDGFIRSDAMLSVVIVSDEEDSSPYSVNEYVNGFRRLKGDARDGVRVSAATMMTRETCPVVGEEGTPGYRYVLAAEEGDGVSVDLCSGDFAAGVAEIAFNASRLRSVFHLAELPDAASIAVYLDGVALPCRDGAWSYQQVAVDGVLGPAIVFDAATLPPPGATVAVYFDVGPGDVASFCPEGT